MNQLIVKAQYAVRGPILKRALEIQEHILKNPNNHGYPFQSIVKCNIGNPQSLGQHPLTFNRRVLSLVLNPQLQNEMYFPPDVTKRANLYLNEIKSAGAYSESQGLTTVRKEVANFINERDQTPDHCKEDSIYLTEGASQGVHHLLSLLISNPEDAILAPIPQYPLYSALTQIMGGYLQGYYLHEEHNWTIYDNELISSYMNAKSNGKNVKALVVINPGNPVGNVLDENTQRMIVSFCHKHSIVLIADEVYQNNIYNQHMFKSFRKIAHDMGLLGSYSSLQLASFHSTSKGLLGECGLRGGYVELNGFSKDFTDQMYKLASVHLCSNIPGQISVGLMANPPKKYDPSFLLHESELQEIHESLFRKSKKLSMVLQSIPGIECQTIHGAMYAFPKLNLPLSFIQEALERQREPDVHYSLLLLEQTGIVVVPGSGFGQRKHTYHIRMTFLPHEDEFDSILERFVQFHTQLMSKYK